METLPWYKSAIIRQQIVALLLAVLGITGLGAKLGDEFDIEKIVTGVFAFAALIIPAWTIFTRLFKPTPPMTETAAKKAEEMKPPIKMGEGGFIRASMLGTLLALSAGVVLATGVVGCVTWNPVAKAQTSEQKAYALYGSFVVAEEAAAKLYVDPNIPQGVKSALRAADAVGKPVADALIDLAEEVFAIRLDVEAGKTGEEKLAIAVANLDRYITESVPKLNALVNALRGAR